MRIAFYVSGNASRLRKIIQEAETSIINNIKLVVCDNMRNSDLMAVLKEKGISCIEFDFIDIHADRRSRNLTLSNLLDEKFGQYNIDYCFCFGERILKGPLLTNYRNRIINFHPSVLPIFPGRMSIDMALQENTFLLGNTAHFIDEGVDTGPVIMQNVVSREIYNVLGYDGVLDQQIIMFRQIYSWLKQNRIMVSGSKVQVLDADYGKTAFFPKVELL